MLTETCLSYCLYLSNLSACLHPHPIQGYHQHCHILCKKPITHLPVGCSLAPYSPFCTQQLELSLKNKSGNFCTYNLPCLTMTLQDLASVFLCLLLTPLSLFTQGSNQVICLLLLKHTYHKTLHLFSLPKMPFPPTLQIACFFQPSDLGSNVTSQALPDHPL